MQLAEVDLTARDSLLLQLKRIGDDRSQVVTHNSDVNMSACLAFELMLEDVVDICFDSKQAWQLSALLCPWIC